MVRAIAAQSTLQLSADNASAVASICQQLEGLPLALELAAARTTMFTLNELAHRLTTSLPLLTNGRRDAPARHRTMHDAIAWSHDLLSSYEQESFRRLAVFVGGFTLDAADAVLQSTDGQTPDTVTSVAGLVDQSLLRHEIGPGDVSRFVMLETLREFGLAQLGKMNEESLIRDAHAAYFAALDDRLDPNRFDPGERFDVRLLRIEADHPNCQAALAHLVATNNSIGVLRLSGSLAAFWHHRGYLREGRRWLEWALDRSSEAAPRLRGRGLSGLGVLMWTQGDAERAKAPLEAACAIAKSIDDQALLIVVLHMFGLIALAQEEWDEAQHYMTEVVRLHRAMGTNGNEAMALNALCSISRLRGDYESSALQGEEALTCFRQIGHASGAAMALCNKASLAVERGDLSDAFVDYLEALQLWASIGERWAIALALGGLADLALRLGQPERAALLVGAIEARANDSGANPWPNARRRCDQTAADARTVLGESCFEAWRATGLTMPLESAISEAVGLSILGG